ncbi:MAG: hypothetical protein WA173_00480 [Pseudomonas sp.]|uniref:hypothetical protein n=1 Tax=Pseudomonas sp. TaxID=306 RepID=UPI003BB5B68A
MNRRNLLKKLPSCLLGALFAAGVASTSLVYAVDGNPTPGLFELEGNTTDDGAAGTDWDALYGGATPGNLITFTGITEDLAPQTIYWKGGSKDINDVTDWWYKDGAVPDKDDITNAYAAAYANPTRICVASLTDNTVVPCATAGAVTKHAVGDLIVYFGLDRYANSGDAFAGFWFFQDAVGLNGSSQFDGQHVARRANPNFPATESNPTLPGDMLVLVEYPQASNAHPEIKVYEWDPADLDHDNVASNLDLLITQSNAECNSLDGKGKLACAITNLDELQAAPAWPYTPKAGNVENLPFESFFEGGVNVTQLLGSTPCFAAFLAETRASRSETATLKDFVIDEFPVCGIDVSKTCDAQLNTSGTAVDVTFNGILDNTGGSAYIAYLKDDQSGSSIDDVCVDLGAPGCADDAPVPGLVLQGDGSAYFPLTGGAVVRYEGSYSTSGLPLPPLEDIVSALAFGSIANVPASGAEPNPDLVIVSDTASASCSFDVNLGLTVVKNCSLAFINGDSVELTVSGTVTNTSDVPLSNVALSDVPFGSLTLSTGDTLAKGETGSFSQTFSLAYGAVFAGETDLGGGLTQVNLSHSDTVTAQGEALAGDGTSLGVTSDSDDANCTDFFSRGIDVSKSCDQVILEPDINGRLVVKVKVTVTVSNIGEEDLSGIVLSDDPAVVFEPYATSLAAGASSFTVDGYYYPTSQVDLTNLTPLEFSDTASVSANGVFSGGEAVDSADVDCPLCPTP